MNYSEKTNTARLGEPADAGDAGLATVRYAEELRALGQALEGRKFTWVDLEAEGDGYRVRAEVEQTEKPEASIAAVMKQFVRSFGLSSRSGNQPAARSTIELRYGAKELQKIIQQGVNRRLDIHAVPEHFSLSHILREAGAYLDNLHHATLARVVVEGRWVTVHYKDSCGQTKELKQDLQFFYDYWVKMYLRRSDRPAASLSTRPTYLTRS